MTLNGLVSHFLFETFRTTTSTTANGGLRAGRQFAGMVFGAMGFVTSVSKKVPMTVLATSSGVETPRVSLKEIGAGFLATGPAMAFLFGTSMLPLRVIGFPTGSTHVTGSEKPRQTGDDVVMAFLVEQDQLFVFEGAKRRDVEGTARIDQDDLVADEGRRGTEGLQGVVTARTQGKASFVVEFPSEASLEWAPPLENAVPFRVLVQSGFGGDEGPGTAELIVILNSDNAPFLGCYRLHCGMTRLGPARFSGSLRRMMDLGDGQLKRIVHFKLFVAVESLRQTEAMVVNKLNPPGLVPVFYRDPVVPWEGGMDQLPKHGHVGGGHGPMTNQGTRCPREGWEGVGDPLPRLSHQTSRGTKTIVYKTDRAWGWVISS